MQITAPVCVRVRILIIGPAFNLCPINHLEPIPHPLFPAPYVKTTLRIGVTATGKVRMFKHVDHGEGFDGFMICSCTDVRVIRVIVGFHAGRLLLLLLLLLLLGAGGRGGAGAGGGRGGRWVEDWRGGITTLLHSVPDEDGSASVSGDGRDFSVV
jgi:hypothetical protein